MKKTDTKVSCQRLFLEVFFVRQGWKSSLAGSAAWWRWRVSTTTTSSSQPQALPSNKLKACLGLLPVHVEPVMALISLRPSCCDCNGWLCCPFFPIHIRPVMALLPLSHTVYIELVMVFLFFFLPNMLSLLWPSCFSPYILSL
jgi:hypothetical protein